MADVVSNSIVEKSIASSWISSWTWSTVISCMRLKYGIEVLTKSSATSVRAMRGSGSPGAGCSDSGSTGWRLSQYGSERSAGSAAMRLCRCVVPVRGKPHTMIGASMRTSWISGCRRSRSWMSSRFASNWTSSPWLLTTPGPLSPASVRNAVQSTSSGSRKPQSPKSDRPVLAIASSMSASGSRRIPSAMATMAFRISVVSGEKWGSARSSMRTCAGRAPTVTGSGSGWHRHRAGVASRAQHGAGEVAGRRPVDDDRAAVHEHAVHAGGSGEQARRTPGEVLDQAHFVGADGLRVEHDEVGVESLAHHAPVPQPEQFRRRLRDEVNGFLHRDELAAADHVGAEDGRVRRAAHAVEVRAGIRPADEHVRVAPRVGAHLPRVLVVVGWQGPQHRSELVVDDDVEQRVERVLTSFPCQVVDGAALEAFVGGGECVADLVATPRGQAAEHARLLRAGALVHPLPRRRVAQLLDALRHGEVHDLVPARQHEERAVVAEAHVHLDEDRHCQRDRLAAARRRVLARRQLRPVPLGLLGVDGEHVPVEGTAGGEGHLRHLLDLVVAE